MSTRRYRRVSTCIWNDRRFRELSIGGKLLFLYFLTTQFLTSLGAMRGSLEGVAAELGLALPKLGAYFREIEDRHMVQYDKAAGFVVLPNFLKHNPPENPNVVKSWGGQLDLLPESPLKNELVERVRVLIDSLPPPFAEALPESFRKPPPRDGETEQLSYRTPDPDPDPDLEPEPARNSERQALETDDFTLKAAAAVKARTDLQRFIACFCQLYAERRGTAYLVNRKRDVPNVRRLLKAFDFDLLVAMAEELQSTDDPFVSRDRTIGMLTLKANWLAERVAERRRGSGTGEDDVLDRKLGLPTFDCPACGGVHEAERVGRRYVQRCTAGDHDTAGERNS